MGNQIAILHLRPHGYLHAAAFNEIAVGLKAGFSELGYTASISENKIIPKARHIVLGGHLLDAAGLSNLPEDTVIFNFEQLSQTNWTMTASYRQALTRFEVWDYSERNIDNLFSFINFN